jgi:hypothetical protein
LLVAAGCIGPVPSAAALVCGSTHATPSALRPYWMPLSRITVFDAVGLQFVNASNLGQGSLRSSPDEGAMGAFFTVASDVGVGEIGPARLYGGIARDEIGSQLGRVNLRVEASVGSEPLFVQSWSETLHLAGNPELRNGSAYSLVLLGPVLDDRRAAGNPPQLILLANDPARATQ